MDKFQEPFLAFALRELTQKKPPLNGGFFVLLLPGKRPNPKNLSLLFLGFFHPVALDFLAAFRLLSGAFVPPEEYWSCDKYRGISANYNTYKEHQREVYNHTCAKQEERHRCNQCGSAGYQGSGESLVY